MELPGKVMWMEFARLTLQKSLPDEEGKIHYQEVLRESALHHIRTTREDTANIADTQFFFDALRYKSLKKTASVTEQGVPRR